MATYQELIEEKLSLLPAKPGVYLMQNRHGVIIYIGKALVLKNRVKSYFRGKIHDRKTKRLVSQIRNFDYIITLSEKEALILEAMLIKKHMPKFNILLKDDKTFPFIKISIHEDFPRIIFTRNPTKDGAKYFGPYRNSQKLRKTLSTLEWLIPLRSCNLLIPLDAPWLRPCIQYQLGKCAAPCGGKIDSKAYKKLVGLAIKFLNGHNTDLLDALKEQMQAESTDLEFEKAAKTRDKIASLQKNQRYHTLYFDDEESRDIIGVYKEDARAAVAVLKVINGKLLNKEIYDLAADEDDEYPQLLASFISQYYAQRMDVLPYQIYLPQKAIGMESLIATFGNKFVFPKKGNKQRLIKMAQENAFNHVEENKLKYLKKKNRTIFSVQELKEKLNLKKLPRKIACFDISTIQGSDTVSSAVFFENGKPKKKSYRHFIIKTVEGQDDFASMQETLSRYLARVKSDDFEKPDLLVIDGGKGQLSSAHAMLCASPVKDIEMISLAKRLEEIYLPGSSESILLPASSPAIRLLTTLRDESHRFAISFHRKRRSSRTLTSALDEISGLGDATKFLLLNEFGSTNRIKELFPSQLMNVKGIGEIMAKRILAHLNKSEIE